MAGAIQANYATGGNRSVMIYNSKFIGKRGISFFTLDNITSTLLVKNSVFILDHIFHDRSFNLINFMGTDLEVSDCEFFQNIANRFYNDIVSSSQETRIKNNRFKSIREDNVTNQYLPNINLTLSSDYIVDIENNIFHTINNNNSFDPFNKINITTSGNPTNNRYINIKNNTEIFEGTKYPFNFISHNHNLKVKSSVISGNIVSTSTGFNEVLYSCLTDSTITLPANVTTEGNIYGDPLLDPDTYQPLWTADYKSPLIASCWI
jgi:hypothetical protein